MKLDRVCTNLEFVTQKFSDYNNRERLILNLSLWTEACNKGDRASIHVHNAYFKFLNFAVD
jgi:hypothetical protein